MFQRSLFLAIFVAAVSGGASGQTTDAKPEKHLQYVMVLKEKAHGKQKEPDVKKAGGKELKRWHTRRLIEIPRAALEELRRDPSVSFLALVNDGTETDAPKYLIGASEDDESSLKVETTGDSTPPEWDSGTYVYDGSGNITDIGTTETYRYDQAQRLSTAVVNGETLTYTYDSFGNQIERRIGTEIVPSTASMATNHLDYAEYDRAGNQLSQLGNPQEYWYDATNMMVVRETAPARPMRYIYTADDERIGTEEEDARWTWTIRDFSGRVLSTFESSGPGVGELTEWIWIESHHYRDGALSSGIKLQERLRNGSGRYFHLDHLGTPRLITNGARQKIALHDYHPFGKEQTKHNQEIEDWLYNAVEPMKFTGHERDFVVSRDSNRHDYLDYMHARYYNPPLGRFLSVDQVMDIEKALVQPQRWNRYSYVENNPINRLDPDGRQSAGFVAYSIAKSDQAAYERGEISHEELVRRSEARLTVAEATTALLGAGEIAGLVRGAVGLTRALVPSATRSLGRWGEARLAQVLGGADVKPSGAFSTSLGKRFVDRLVNGVAHEANAGLNVKLTSALENQMMKDAELVATGQFRGAHWHFFRGVSKEVLKKLDEYGIKYTVHQ